jgi:DNA-binding IclR family transcriptional regulator
VSRGSPQTERLVELVDFLASAGYARGRTLAEIARHLEVHKATCYPMLRELVGAGWLIRNPVSKRYRLGPALVSIGKAARVIHSVSDRARNEIRLVARDTGLVCLSLLRSGDDMVIADLAQPAEGLGADAGLRPGDSILLRPPLGAVFAAFSSANEIERWLQREPECEVAGVRHACLDALSAIRRRGFSVQQCRSRSGDMLFEPWDSTDRDNFRVVRRRHLDRLRDLPCGVLVGDLEADRTYWPFSVNAPVLDENDETPELALSILFPGGRSGVTGDELAAMGTRLRWAASRLSLVQRGRSDSGD